MDYRGINKRTYKNLKKEIVEDTALNVGYYNKVINEINYETLLETFKDIALKGWINQNTDTQELSNMLVTESVKNMNYQEFKDIADNFFSFVPDDKEKWENTKEIKITKEEHKYLLDNLNKVAKLEKEIENLKKENVKTNKQEIKDKNFKEKLEKKLEEKTKEREKHKEINKEQKIER